MIAYTGLDAGAPAAARPRASAAANGSRATSARCGCCSIPCSSGPARASARCGRRSSWRSGSCSTTEVGVVLGYLAQRVLGQYELVLLDEAVEDRPPRLLFVLPNLGQAVTNFGADEQEFMTWVTLHEVTHAVQFAGVPWLHGHVAGPRAGAAAQRRAADRGAAQAADADAAPSCGGSRDALRHGDLISIVTDESERETLDRVQAVMAVIEGHAEHVMDAVAPDLLPVAAAAARGDRPPAQVAVGPLAAARAAARARDQAPPVRAGQVLLRRDRRRPAASRRCITCSRAPRRCRRSPSSRTRPPG